MSRALSRLSICSVDAIAELSTDVDLGGGAGMGIAIGLIVLIIRGSVRAVVMGWEGLADAAAKNGGVCISPCPPLA